MLRPIAFALRPEGFPQPDLRNFARAEGDQGLQQLQRSSLLLTTAYQRRTLVEHHETAQCIKPDRPMPRLTSQWWGIGKETTVLDEASNVIYFDARLQSFDRKKRHDRRPPEREVLDSMLPPQSHRLAEYVKRPLSIYCG